MFKLNDVSKLVGISRKQLSQWRDRGLIIPMAIRGGQGVHCVWTNQDIEALKDWLVLRKYLGCKAATRMVYHV